MKNFWSKNKPFLLLVLLKLSFTIFFINHLKDEKTSCFIKIPDYEIGADDEGYFSTVENLLETGEYYYDGINASYKMYAPRVPGLSLVYLLFRFLLQKT